MNGVDARRVLRVVHDLQSHLWALESSRTPAATSSLILTKDSGREVATSGEKSQAWQALLSNINALSTITTRKLAVTVEEDKSMQDYFEEACRREKKTLRERQNMEDLLQTERDDRQAESLEMLKSQHRVDNDLNTVAHLREQKLQTLSATADVQEEENQTVHDAQAAALLHDIRALEQELHALHQAQAVSEGALRKKKAKAEQEVEVWAQKHADEVGLKQRELDEAVCNCQAVLHELEECTHMHAQLLEDRQAYEARKEEEARVRQARLAQDLLRKRAAKAIQRAWKVYQKHLQAKKKGLAKADAKAGKKGSGRVK
eukprot:jgi/Botrbrau1/9142/Bobra.160_3s0015.1